MSFVKEKIYTIPVNDAFAADSPCPLCTLSDGLEAQLLDYYLGPSLMEPDTRQVTNRSGFCAPHMTKLYASQKNRLGLGLMLHTHLQDIHRDMERRIPGSAGGKKSLFGRGGDSKLADAAAHLRARANDCIICTRMAETMARYIEVIMWQFLNEKDFTQKFRESRGFCLKHTADLMDGADRSLKGDDQEVFIKELWTLQDRQLEALTGDVEWFTLKFDYRNHDAPWKNSKDALPRALYRLGGLRPLEDPK